MTSEVLVIGAGPAGMAAAVQLLSYGLTVTVVDDQPLPGGRIFAALETRQAKSAEDTVGAELIAKFREAGGEYRSRTEVWQIEAGLRVFLTSDSTASMIQPQFILFATGAQERPMPFSGWELPGVMTVGAAQMLLKTAQQIPDEPVWLAGSGPLLLLYAKQLIDVGGRIAGILDTTPAPNIGAVARTAPGALGHGWRDLLRGIAWLYSLRGVKRFREVVSLEAHGEKALERIRFQTRTGEGGEIEARHLFIHSGIVPSVHGTMAAGCEHRWNDKQRCFEPVTDDFRASTLPGIFVAGDGATVLGARAAMISGKLSAIGIARAAGRIDRALAEKAGAALRDALKAAARFRTLLDAVFPFSDLHLSDDTVACRCEEISAGCLREALRDRPLLGCDGVKISTRAGMGPCQGRQCGLTLARLVSEVHRINPAKVEFLRIRPPLKPLTISELASLDSLP